MTIATPTNNVSNAGFGFNYSLVIPSAGTISVTAGELIVVNIARYTPTSQTVLVGDISNSGTATLGAWSLDRTDNGTTDGGSSYAAQGIFSAIVTGSGTLAITIAGKPATTYTHGSIISVPGNWDASRLEASNGQIVSTGTTSVSTGSMSSAGIGLFVGTTQINTSVGSVAASASATDMYRALSPDTGASAYRISTGALTYAFTWTTDINAVFGATGVVYKEVAGGDTTAPVLTSATGSATGSSTATVGATTDEGNGTLYAVVTSSATQPSVAQIKAGQDHTGATAPWSGSQAVSSTGAKTLSATGLSPTTAYYAHLVHTDAATNDSNRVSSASFTTFQRAAPASDVSAGSWTASSGSDLFAMIDEASPSDADYIKTSTPADVCTVALGSLSDPSASTGHQVSYRISGDGVSGIQVALMQNTTVIASWTHDPAPGTSTTYTQTLSGAEADSITNYAALRLRFTEV